MSAPRRPGAESKPIVLHCHSSFDLGGKERRCAQLINAFGPALRHHIVSGNVGRMGAASLIDAKIAVQYPDDFPALQGRPTPGRLLKLAQALKPYDLILTYNWGAIDVVMAHTLFCDALGLPPLIHHEDGFNEDEAHRRKRSRNWYRRIALGKSAGLVVPSETLEEIALEEWQQPIARVKHIPNGIDTAAFRKAPRADSLRNLIKRDGEMWVGTMAGLRPVKQLPMLVRALAALPDNWHLVIAGQGPERDAILAEAERLEIDHRVHLPGHIGDPAKIVGLFDIMALSSKSEQFPISVAEAMAAGLPVVAPDVGDIRRMVVPENAHLIIPANDDEALAQALRDSVSDVESRIDIGRANREKAIAHFDQKVMIEAYRRLYSSALGQPI